MIASSLQFKESCKLNAARIGNGLLIHVFMGGDDGGREGGVNLL